MPEGVEWDRLELPGNRLSGQASQRPRIAVELDRGRPFVGVDHQVGHSSKRYATVLASEILDDEDVWELWLPERDDDRLRIGS